PGDTQTITSDGGDLGTDGTSGQVQVPIPVNLGTSEQLIAIGDFADQTGAVLPASYVNWQSSNTAVMNVTSNGIANAVSDGTTVILVSAAGLQAVTAGTVGYPSDSLQQYLYVNGIQTSIHAETLVAHIGSHRLDVSS